MSGGYARTTVSEMELVAAIEALRSLPTGVQVDLYSDSQYLIYGMSSGRPLAWRRAAAPRGRPEIKPPAWE